MPWWVLLTLGLASGGFSVLRDLYFLASGVQPARNTLLTFIEVCAILAAWGMWFRERRLRLQLEQPEVYPSPNVQPVSATNIRAQLTEGRYSPFGADFAAICTIHNCKGSPKLKNVRARIAMIRKKDNFQVLDIPSGCWMNESKPNIDLIPESSRDLVVAHWVFKQLLAAAGEGTILAGWREPRRQW